MTADILNEILSLTSKRAYIVLADAVFPLETGGETVLHLCNAMEPITFGGYTYVPFSFTYTPPPEKDTSSGTGTASITCQLVGQELTDPLLNLGGEATLTMHTVVLNSGAVETLEITPFKLTKISFTEMTLNATLDYDMYFDTLIPGYTYDAENFPGCW